MKDEEEKFYHYKPDKDGASLAYKAITFLAAIFFIVTFILYHNGYKSRIARNDIKNSIPLAEEARSRPNKGDEAQRSDKAPDEESKEKPQKEKTKDISH